MVNVQLKVKPVVSVVRPNHFAKVCFSNLNKTHGRNNRHRRPPQHSSKSHIHQVSSEQCEHISSSSDDEYLYTLNNNSTDTKTLEVCVKVNGISIKMIVDTGASTDILDENTFSKIKQLKNIKLQTPTKRIFAYGSNSQLTALGTFATKIEFKNNRCTSSIHVLQGNHGSLLSYKTASNLGIIDVKLH